MGGKWLALPPLLLPPPPPPFPFMAAPLLPLLPLLLALLCAGGGRGSGVTESTLRMGDGAVEPGAGLLLRLYRSPREGALPLAAPFKGGL